MWQPRLDCAVHVTAIVRLRDGARGVTNDTPPSDMMSQKRIPWGPACSEQERQNAAFTADRSGRLRAVSHTLNRRR